MLRDPLEACRDSCGVCWRRKFVNCSHERQKLLAAPLLTWDETSLLLRPKINTKRGKFLWGRSSSIVACFIEKT